LHSIFLSLSALLLLAILTEFNQKKISKILLKTKGKNKLVFLEGELQNFLF
jgi:hypothetical protein